MNEIKTKPIPDHLFIDYDPNNIASPTKTIQSAWDKEKKKRLDTLERADTINQLINAIQKFAPTSALQNELPILLEKAAGILIEMEDELGITIR